MKTVWTTSSLGITFNGANMAGVLEANDNFCKDTTIGEAYHSGNCWREVVAGGTPGLHFCTPDEVHIDPHQTSTGRQGGVQFGGGSWVRLRSNYCSGSLLSFLDHMLDVEGGRPVNVFHHHSKLGGRIESARSRANGYASRYAEAREMLPVLDGLEARRLALSDTLRTWATRGFERDDGSAEARPVVQELAAIDADLTRPEMTLRGIFEKESPSPTGIYSY